MKQYKSPSHKLISFFKKSRDQWKAKYLSSQEVTKYLKNRISFLTRSKEHWKEKAKTLEQELRMKEKAFAKEQSRFLQEQEALKKKQMTIRG